MFRKKVFHKARVGLRVIHEGGFLAFLALSLEFVAKYLRAFSKKRHTVESQGNPIYTCAIYTCVKYADALRTDFHKPLPKWPGTKKQQLTLNWIMPPPGRGSGGHLNIFRFIKALEDAGHKCRIYIYTQSKGGLVKDIRANMGNDYSDVKAPMYWLEDEVKMQKADGIFATSWETAYPAFNAPFSAKRFYFVQDFEPYFHAPGSLYALAENTYRFGFFGITAGKWLSKKLEHDYGMRTHSYDFGVDTSLYSPVNTKPRKEVLFYARPFTERRGFEMGVMALDLFHKKHPEYTVNMVGYDVSNYSIPFSYKNLKTLDIHELNSLYNRCATALVLSFTNMSLLPLELLASGTIPVVNQGENNELVSNNKFIAYSPSDPISLASTLSSVVERKDLLEYSQEASAGVQKNTWREAQTEFVRIVEKEIRSHE